MGLDDPIIVRYARWFGLAKERSKTEYHFTVADKLKNDKRYILVYTDGTNEYVIGDTTAGIGENDAQFPVMIPIVSEGGRKINIRAVDTDKYGENMRKYLFTAQFNKEDGSWVFENKSKGFLTLNENGYPHFSMKRENTNYAAWQFDIKSGIISNVNWQKNNNKYLTFSNPVEELTDDNFLTLDSEGKAKFKLYAIDDGKFNGLLQGNLGYSTRKKAEVIDIIGTPMLNSIMINVGSTLIALAITIPLGIYCAVHARKPIDTAVQTITIIGYSLPSFLIAILFIFVFAVKLRWFPPGGFASTGSDLVGGTEFTDRLYYMALPVLAMVFMSLAGMTRSVRATMLDTLSQDYIRTARAKGLKEKVVIYSHAWRNALLPVSGSIIGSFIGIFMGGSIVIEQIFALNGIQKLYIESLNASDFEVVMGLQMFYELISLFGVLLTDVCYTLIDPRVRIDK